MDSIEIGEIFTLVDEENEEEFEVEVLDFFEVDGNDYLVVGLLQEEVEYDEDDEIDVFFLRVGKGEELSMVESEEEFQQVVNAFEEYINDESDY